MPTDLLAPASSQGAVDSFLSTTLTAMKPAETTSTASANETKPVTVAPPAEPAKAVTAPATPPVSSDGEKTTEAKAPDMEAIHKQLGEQTRANKKLGKSNIELLKKNQELAKELQEIRAKLDPSYTPPAGPTPEQERALIEFQAREAASRKAAEDRYGVETVQAKVYAEESPYRTLISEYPWVHQRVLGSDTPVLEIFQVLDEFEVLNTYGRSPVNVLENVEKTIKDKLWKEWTAQAKGTTQEGPGKPVATLSDARGEDGRQDARPTPKFDLSSFNRHIP